MNDNQKPDRLAYSVTEAAHLLGFGKTTMYGLMESGKLPFCRIGTRRRIRSVDLHALLAEQSRAA